ncbi:glycosyltransferase [Cryobacterium roopkundense]
MERMFISTGKHFSNENIINSILGQGETHPFADDLRQAGYAVHVLPNIDLSRRSRKSLRDLVKAREIDVVHVHTEKNYLQTVLACRLALGPRGKVIRTVHNVFMATGFWRVKRFAQALLADRLVFALIAPSPDVAANERTLGRSAQVIYNWVDDRYSELASLRSGRKANEQPLALIVGNCSDIKNHSRALRAISATNHHLIHFGNEAGASQEEIDLLNALDLQHRLVGRGTHAPDDALKVADYYAMPSRNEGMPVALAEALVSGVPAFVSDAPGLRWAKGLTGVTCLAEDDGAWMHALQSGNVGATVAGAGSVDFSAARGARQYADIYRAASTVKIASLRRTAAPKLARVTSSVGAAGDEKE